MKREELLDHLGTLFYAVISLNAIMIFIIPAIICRLVNDNDVIQ